MTYNEELDIYVIAMFFVELHAVFHTICKISQNIIKNIIIYNFNVFIT